MRAELSKEGNVIISGAVGAEGSTMPGDDAVEPNSGAFVAILAQNHELRAQLEQARAENARLAERQRRLMDLLGTQSPDHLLHDLRNALNERELFRTLADSMDQR